MGKSVSARLFDPLWMITRQWQMGEFQGEDAGTPVQARVRATSALLSRCHLGELPPQHATPQASRYDPLQMPLEVMVERRPMRASSANDVRMLTLAVEAGLHFLRMLELQPLSQELPPGVHRQVRAAAAIALRSPTPLTTPRGVSCRRWPGVHPTPVCLQQRSAATALHKSCSTPLWRSPPATASRSSRPLSHGWRGTTAYSRNRLRHPTMPGIRRAGVRGVGVGEPVGSARQRSDADRERVRRRATRLEQLRRQSRIRAREQRRSTFTAVTETTVPAPVIFRGAPAPRFWELEDSRLAYGLVPVGPTDLAQLMMIEYVSSYGNDWFLVPLTLPVGSLTAVNSLVVTDSFGVRNLLRPIGDAGLPAPYWSMWRSSALVRAGDALSSSFSSDKFFLPPTLGASPGRQHARGRSVHARRDGQRGVGHRANARESARASAPRYRQARRRPLPPTRLLQPLLAPLRAICSRRPCRRTGSRCFRFSCRPTRARSSRV